MRDKPAPLSKIAMVRLDRLGDVCVTLPVDEIPALQGVDCHWWIHPATEFVVQHAQPKRHYSTLQSNRGFSWSEFWKFHAWLRNERPSHACIFHGPWWIALALFMARVPIRGGVLSKWYSFLFYNRGLRQKRSLATQHERDYNLDLLDYVLASDKKTDVKPFLKLTPHAPSATLPQLGLLAKKYIVVHAGMAGSARNWPVLSYVNLILALLEKNETVVMTGTEGDRAYLEPIREAVRENKRMLWLDGKLHGNELLDVLWGARSVVVPSTGVAHLAAALGTPVIGIYSPVRVQAPRRWAPLGENVQVLVPSVDCPGQLTCIMEQCRFFDCMKTIQPETVLRELESLKR